MGIRRPVLRAWVRAVLIAAFGIGVGAWAASAAYTQFALRYSGVETQARMVVTHTVGKYLECEVSYQDSTGVRHETWLNSQCGGVQAGHSFAVRYLPSSPTTVAAASTLSLVSILSNESGYLIVGLGAILFCVVGVLAVTGVLGRWAAS